MFTNKLLWTYRIMFVQPPDVVWQLEIYDCFSEVFSKMDGWWKKAG